MKNNTNNLSRSEKILLFLYKFGKGKKTKVRFEDIVVGVFKKHPSDFHLKGYVKYPDSGDLIHKPLYDFKKKGYVNAENKIFSLTDRGAEFAEQLQKKSRGVKEVKGHRLSRSTEIELARIKMLEGFILFEENKNALLSDNDFYNYLGVSVRTQKNAFMGRLHTIKAVINELGRGSSNPLYRSIIAYHEHVINKYKDTINFFLKK